MALIKTSHLRGFFWFGIGFGLRLEVTGGLVVVRGCLGLVVTGGHRSLWLPARINPLLTGWLGLFGIGGDG